jgi:7-cyano-7-deazaguanine synthase in queuosine biosynthesis
VVEKRERIVAFDFDGVLCDDAYPGVGAPKLGYCEAAKELWKRGYTVIVFSSRRSLDYQEVRRFCDKHIYPGMQIALSSKPVADVYFDDKGLLPAARLIPFLVEAWLKGSESALRTTCGYAARDGYSDEMANVPENPASEPQTDTAFRVYVPVTGGMDSTTLWRQARESGVPYELVYCDFGQDVLAQEWLALNELAFRFDPGAKLRAITRTGIAFARFKHIALGRNAAIALTVAEHMTRRGHWGEIWFGNLGGESPVRGGDKSRRWLNDTQALLVHLSHDVRLQSPLIGWDKTDIVRYWDARGEVETLMRTKCCFSPDERLCGVCQSCCRMWMAFAAEGYDIKRRFGPLYSRDAMRAHVNKYRAVVERVEATRDYSHYSPARVRGMRLAIAAFDEGES